MQGRVVAARPVSWPKNSSENIKRTLFEQVKKVYKTDLSYLAAVPDLGTNSTPYHDSKTVYISEPGLYQLIFSSRLEAAEKFRTWVFEDHFDKVVRQGLYSSPYPIT